VPLCRYARHRGLDGPDAEDLVAQALEIAWRRLDEVPVDDPLPWLYAVARNLWRNQARRDRRRRDLLSRFQRPHEADGAPALDRAAPDPAAADSGGLRTALSSLSEGDQEILRLAAWDGLTPGELATVLGCSPAAARTRLHRARARLARRLGLNPRHPAPSRRKQPENTCSVEVPQ
jgi:RNA polymerase sigma-70 factor (ECF subfamily)